MDANEIRQRLLDYDNNLANRIGSMTDDEIKRLWESIRTYKRGFLILLINGSEHIPFFTRVDTPVEDNGDPLDGPVVSEAGLCEEFIWTLTDEYDPEGTDRRIRRVATSTLEEVRDTINDQLEQLRQKEEGQL